ncbi:MAG: DUF2335 domain-containing protein, partial [Spirochaetaceae bacterium]|nr:DUF2335 domain-containing protein [Spirochaetaceae bacterium]
SQNRENVKSVQSIYQGPIPTPEMLKAYNEIDSTLVNRIILMAEKTMTQISKLTREHFRLTKRL